MNDTQYEYGGARVMVDLHQRYLREFLATWKQAEEKEVALPETDNPVYASREALLHHVLGCAARYLIWMCEKLELPMPDIEARPPLDSFASRAEDYLEQVLAAWEVPLRGVTEEQADTQAFASTWGIPYSIDGMLEHAVMHPIRHSYQLEHLIQARPST